MSRIHLSPSKNDNCWGCHRAGRLHKPHSSEKRLPAPAAQGSNSQLTPHATQLPARVSGTEGDEESWSLVSWACCAFPLEIWKVNVEPALAGWEP